MKKPAAFVAAGFLLKWCGREDSNFHGSYPTATSTLRVYQFRHDRTAWAWWRVFSEAPDAKERGFFARRGFAPGHRRPVAIALHHSGITDRRQRRPAPMVEWRHLAGPRPLRGGARRDGGARRRHRRRHARPRRSGCWSIRRSTPPAPRPGAADLTDPDRFPVYHAGRGGQYTYHGPGQRVVYVMLDLNAPRPRRAPLRPRPGRLGDRHAGRVQRHGRDAATGRVGVWVTRPDRPPQPRRQPARGQDRRHRRQAAPLGQLPRPLDQRRARPRRISTASCPAASATMASPASSTSACRSRWPISTPALQQTFAGTFADPRLRVDQRCCFTCNRCRMMLLGPRDTATESHCNRMRTR